MKPKMTLALVALITSSAFAAIPAVLPEFKNEKKLAEWRAEMAAKSNAVPPASEVRCSTLDIPSPFYTGKPYIGSTGSYAFKYRSYNPELARWTTEDPSGFLDGANNLRYVSVPTRSFDVAGLLDWNTLNKQDANPVTFIHGNFISTYDVWQVKTDDGQYNINLLKLVSTIGTIPVGSDPTYNCHGYTFGKKEYWINGQVDDILKGDGYKLITGENKTGARVAYWGDNVHTAVVNTVENGVVTKVTGKIGAAQLLPSTPAVQGYEGTIQYYE